MRTICEKFLEEVLSPELKLSNEAKKHLTECEECALLRADVMTFAPVAPADSLNDKIFATKPTSKHIWRWVSVAAAASIFAVVGIGIFADSPLPKTTTNPKIAPKTALVASNTQTETNVEVKVSFDLSALEEASYDLDTELSAYSYALSNF